LLRAVGISRIPYVTANVVIDGAVISLCAGLGENLDAAIAKLVVFGREGILVDADLTNRILRRKISAAKTIDKNRAAAGPGGWPSKSLQVGLEVGRIVR